MQFDAGASQMSWPGLGGATITPSDTADLAKPTRGILVAVAGDLKLTYWDGSTDTLPLAANTIYPLCAKRIFATGTTATGIHAVY